MIPVAIRTSRRAPHRIRRLGAALAAAATAALIALPTGVARAAEPGSGDYHTDVSVAVSADDGLTITVTGSGYVDLPPSSTGYAAGIYAVLQNTVTQDADYLNDHVRDLTPGPAFVTSDDIIDGDFTTDITLDPADFDALDPDGDYRVITWAAHGFLNDTTRIDTAPVTFTEAQRAILFGDSGEASGSESAESSETTSSAAETSTTAGTTTESSPTVQCHMETIPAVAGTPHLQWGIKSSFVGYVDSGLSGGKITTSNGAARDGDSFTWGKGSGSLGSDDAGTLSFPGRVHFTAHDGVLDTALSHLRLVIDPDGTGTLVADAASNDRDGNDVSADDVTFATLTFTSLDKTGGTAHAALTEAGARAFAGFYATGETLDDLSLSITGARGEQSVQRCHDADGTLVDENGNPIGDALSYTGVDTARLSVLALGTLALGALLILSARRRTSAAHR